MGFIPGGERALHQVCFFYESGLLTLTNPKYHSVGRFRASRDVPLPYDLPNPPHSQSSSAADTSSTQSPTNATSSNPLRLPTPPHLRHRSHDNYPNPDLDVESQPLSPSLDRYDRPSTDLTPYPSHTSTSAPTSSSIRHRRPRTSTTISVSGEGNKIVSRGFARLGSAITSAHAQDFERRLPAEALGRKHESDDDDDDEEEKEEEEKQAVEKETVRRERQNQVEAETAHGGGDQHAQDSIIDRQRGDGSQEGNRQHEQQGDESDDPDDEEDTRDLRHAEELLEDAGESNHPPS